MFVPDDACPWEEQTTAKGVLFDQANTCPQDETSSSLLSYLLTKDNDRTGKSREASKLLTYPCLQRILL